MKKSKKIKKAIEGKDSKFHEYWTALGEHVTIQVGSGASNTIMAKLRIENFQSECVEVDEDGFHLMVKSDVKTMNKMIRAKKFSKELSPNPDYKSRAELLPYKKNLVDIPYFEKGYIFNLEKKHFAASNPKEFGDLVMKMEHSYPNDNITRIKVEFTIPGEWSFNQTNYDMWHAKKVEKDAKKAAKKLERAAQKTSDKLVKKEAWENKQIQNGK